MRRYLLTVIVLAACTSSNGADEVLGPHDEAATVRLDLIKVAPSVLRPGEVLEMFFPEETLRGIHFVLEAKSGDSWSLKYHLISDWGGTEQPQTYEAQEMDVDIPDVGIGGPGPDSVLIPEDAEPGDYRVCTGNSKENFCAPVRLDP